MFAIHEDRTVSYAEPPQDGEYYTCVAETSLGLMAGTSGNHVVLFDAGKSGFSKKETIETDDLSYEVKIFKDREKRTWLCTETGFGYIGTDGVLYQGEYDDFSVSIQGMHEDYEGNLWFASSRYGVLKLSRNYFENMFVRCGAETAVTNAAVVHNGFYYCGTDNGLVILNLRDRTHVENDLTAMLEGIRVRSLMEDSRGNLWIATYSDYGLICLTSDGRKVFYNTDTCDVTGNRFRCMAELSDGSIAAGASSGINVIKDGALSFTLNSSAGMRNEQILSLLDGGDGSFYAGTNGAGIYHIRDGKIIENLTMDSGLSSDIVLRMHAYKDGFFIVASNALQYYDGTEVKKIPHFPYFNNYDILTDGDNAYVVASCGVYEVKAPELLSGEPFAYKLYNNADGLSEGLTSNAWNCLDTDGTLLLCTNSGLLRWDRKGSARKISYRLGVTAVRGDGNLIEPVDGIYHIPAEVQRISVRASVRNYALSNVKVRFYIDDIAVNDEVVSQEDLQTVQINNLSSGTYTAHLQVLSSDESQVLQEETYIIEKEAHFWETAKYRVYLAVMLIWIVIFVTWVCTTVYQLYNNRVYLTEQKAELEQTVEQQTENIRQQSEKMMRFQWDVIESMATLIESRDGNTGEHVLRTRDYVRILVNELLEKGMYSETVTAEFAEDMIHLAPLHDVGKIKIPDAVLNKPGKLNEEEYELMKKHTVYGGEIIGKILGKEASPNMTKLARELATFHHERPDGMGYPAGMAGDSIPLAARIMAIADVFDAITSPRVYKKAKSFEEGFSELEKNAGTQFDAELVTVFLSKKAEILALEKDRAESV